MQAQNWLKLTKEERLEVLLMERIEGLVFNALLAEDLGNIDLANFLRGEARFLAYTYDNGPEFMYMKLLGV